MNKDVPPPLRLAIVSTPRTGNNWVQHLLSRVYDLPRLSPVNLPNVRWSELPPACVIILHWRCEPELARLLNEHHFRVVSIARHPFDVLISILHFTLRDTTDGWLQGEAGNERLILGLTPRSPAFIDYACGPRARALLAVSREWWRYEDCLKVRYENLVADPHAEMQRLIDKLGVAPRHPLEEAIAATTLTDLRGQFPERKYHFWQGTPGLWRTLLTTGETERIMAVHAELFGELNYIADADPHLLPTVADARWRELLGIDASEDVTLWALQNALFQVKRDLERTRYRLAQLEAMGPAALDLARRIKQWGRRFPLLASVLKRWIR